MFYIEWRGNIKVSYGLFSYTYKSLFIDKSITTQKDWPTNNDQLINNDISGILQRTHYLHFSMNIIVLEWYSSL